MIYIVNTQEKKRRKLKLEMTPPSLWISKSAAILFLAADF